MAWRDSRRSKSRLLLFGSSVILGIAALVAIYSLGDNLKKNVDQQAAELIGADLEISGNSLPPPAIQLKFDSLQARTSEERSFASMIYFPLSKGSRLVQVRALEGGFPYYGKLATVPAAAADDFKKAQTVLVDRSLMLQFRAKVGDSVQVGNLKFRIAGTLLKAPGQTGLGASVAPVVYMPLKWLDSTGLMQKGSRVNYSYYVKFSPTTNVQQFVDSLGPRLESSGYDLETVETRKRGTGRSFEDLNRFLELVAFIALLLGCIGVASAIHIYVREKISMIALLRCLGTSSREAFLIYLMQILGISVICSLAGAALGTLIQQLLPMILGDFLPVTITTSLSWGAIGQGILIGVIISMLFALLPLVSIRLISPLNVLRMSFDGSKLSRDPARWLLYITIAVFLFLLMNVRISNWQRTAVLLTGILIAMLLLAGVAWLLTWSVRRFFPASWAYVWRQGLSNLYRPNNQTLLLITSIGFGTAFICTLFFIQGILINRVKISSSADQPNVVLFDIQNEQREGVVSLAKRQGLPLRPTVPIVNMRLEQWNGKTAADVLEDTSLDINSRMFSREYRVTYRDTLTPLEKVTAGEWRGSVTQPSDQVYISLEERFAKRIGVKLWDTLQFNVQGLLITTVVSSLRIVDWNRIYTNFVVVFPKGVLEKAPQFHVLLTRASTPEVSAAFQQSVVTRFPNVSIIDLNLVLSVVDDLLNKIAFVVRFIAGFSIITALVVLIASVLISRYQRMQENVLLRTLGASGRQIFTITAIEYFLLGLLSALTGLVISLAASWGLAHYAFDTIFTPALLPALGIAVGICAVSLIIGLVNSRGALHKPPMTILGEI